ncbi:hypothetical protein [Streptomyces sp. NPDC051636]|uniref:hypothetical protein n=1 Tax=Streptomyces sp. NPDC051636 TaxID=3365663 RepID=UPI0037987237
MRDIAAVIKGLGDMCLIVVSPPSGVMWSFVSAPSSISPAAIARFHPGAAYARKHVLVLELRLLDRIAGPRHVAWGNAFEYILLNGFEADAIASKWEVALW